MASNYNIDSHEPSLHAKNQITTVNPETLKNNRIVMGLHNDPNADIFRVLRTNILRQLRENSWDSFAVTSTTPNEGKTSLSINLAIAIALEGSQTVILIDADFRRPRIAHYLGLPINLGVFDYLTGIASLDDVLLSMHEDLTNPGFDNLVVLPGRESRINSSELISSSKMKVLIREIKLRYQSQIIILDIPPLLVADDAMLLLPHVDATVLVVEDGKNSSEELQHSMHILEQTNLLGLVLNKSKPPPFIYQYGYAQDTSAPY
jgi:protein-tyrosine kinase